MCSGSEAGSYLRLIDFVFRYPLLLTCTPLPLLLYAPWMIAAGGDVDRDNPGANLKSISHRCHPILVAFVWELTRETIDLPLG